MQEDDDKFKGDRPSVATHEVKPPAAESDLDLRRRRLMRGAVVAVPAILTLRSGAVAAATSLCPQIKGTANVKDSGKIGAKTPSAWPTQVGDVCALPGSTCPKYGDTLGNVTVNPDNGKLYCIGKNVPANPFAGQSNVVIVSESSALSLL